MTARLRVGLLECDHVDPRYRGLAGGDYRDMFRTLFAANAPSVDLVPFDVVNGDWPGTDGADGYVCTGSRHGVNDGLAWVDKLIDFVADVHEERVPFVGICFGHQVLAKALGGRVERAAQWGAGVHCTEIVDTRDWMGTNTGPLALHYMHQDQVVALPSGTTVLGRTDHCPIAMFEAGGTALGMQAHPEFVATYTGALLDARELRIGADVTSTARASLATPTNEAVAADWIDRFFSRITE
ncbi:MAG: amidotransferase [Acidimicrobiales bacterium]